MTTTPPSAGGTAGARFPTLPGRDLEGRRRTLPDAFDAPWNLVLVAFRREQQSVVDEWVTWHRSVAGGRPGFEAWEVPVIGVRWAPARRFIDGGMARAVREQEARRHTLTVYTNLARATDDLEVSDTGVVQALLVDGGGVVRWRSTGTPTPDAVAAVLALVDAPTV